VPISVDWVIDTTAGCGWCSLPCHCSQGVSRSGDRRPSSVGIGTIVEPVKRAGAPHSSTTMCALAAVRTACHGRSTLARPTTLAPVPPQQKYECTGPSNTSRRRAWARRVQSSSP